jgi:hypothetical protein
VTRHPAGFTGAAAHPIRRAWPLLLPADRLEEWLARDRAALPAL